MFINTNSLKKKNNINPNLNKNKLTLINIVNNLKLHELLYQILCLSILAFIYKNNVSLIHIFIYHDLNKENKENKKNKENEKNYINALNYYKVFILIYFMITIIINVILFTKSIFNFNGILQILLFIIIQLIFISVIFIMSNNIIHNLHLFNNNIVINKFNEKNNINIHFDNFKQIENIDNDNDNFKQIENIDNDNDNFKQIENIDNDNDNFKQIKNIDNDNDNFKQIKNIDNDNDNFKQIANIDNDNDNDKKKNIKQNINFPNIDKNPDLPYKSSTWMQMRDYKTTKLPDYVKNPNKKYNKPEHYDYTPDDIPQWMNDKDLVKNFQELKDKWDKDPNRGYRESIKAYDSGSLPYMEGGLDMIYPDTELKNLFEMKREQNLANSIILAALEEGGYDNKYVHNTEHLRRYDSCKLNAMQHNNSSRTYIDPNVKFLHLDKFPNPKFNTNLNKCNNDNNRNNNNKNNNNNNRNRRNNNRNKNTNKDDIYDKNNKRNRDDRQNENDESKKKTIKLNLQDSINYDKPLLNVKIPNLEYLYKSDEINTQYLNYKSGDENYNTKSKNINQYCTNYPPPNNEQLRQVNDNVAYSINDKK